MQLSSITTAPTAHSPQAIFSRYQQDIVLALHKAVASVSSTTMGSNDKVFSEYYGQMQYHLGWVNAAFLPIDSYPGKLLRPTLLLLAYEMASAQAVSAEKQRLRRALPAAAAVELIHNFTLIHDDIEDADDLRRHRPTVWKIWGIPQAINTGDGMIFVARLALWDVLKEGVDSEVAVQLSQILDRAILKVTEGQYLDIRVENVPHISLDCYKTMIERKTATLISCAAEMGALLGCKNAAVIDGLRDFGLALGLAFQIRDDLLGTWSATSSSGKVAAGDIARRKKSLPILHALSTASADDRQLLSTIYQQQTPITPEQVDTVLAIFTRTGTKAYCQHLLSRQCQQASEALKHIPYQHHPYSEQAYADMQALIHFVAEYA